MFQPVWRRSVVRPLSGEARAQLRFLHSPQSARTVTRELRRPTSMDWHPVPETTAFKWKPNPRRLAISGNKILVIRPGKAGREPSVLPVSGRFLRDNCSCPQCRNQDTAQRQINVLKGTIDCSITSASMSEDDRALNVIFGDGHKSAFAKSLIIERTSTATSLRRSGMIPIKLWDAKIESSPPTVQFESLRANGLQELLASIRRWGFCFVDGMPATPEATETLLTAIGPIRNTHYGGFYDFTADLSSKDTAYTSESLEPHTDNTYFSDPTGLQALHLLSHTEGSGGESSLVDGFAAAAKLFAEDRGAYQQLSMTKVYAHASGNEGISIQPMHGYPVLKHHRRDKYLTQVRWNNADRAGLDCDLSTVDAWYEAASKFDAIISDPRNQYRFQLTPGKTLIFDNWRCLHGRAAFTGKRRMCGGYINRDDYVSKFRMTNFGEEDIRASTVTG